LSAAPTGSIEGSSPGSSEADPGRPGKPNGDTFALEAQAPPKTKQIKPPKTAKAKSPQRLLAEAFAAGHELGGSRGYAVPFKSQDLAALMAAAKAHAKSPSGELLEGDALLDWIRENAARFRRAFNAAGSNARFWSGRDSAAGFETWLRGGVPPEAAAARVSGAQPAPTRPIQSRSPKPTTFIQ
jgi:hypothetical protein